jgi:hypothetical protein
MNVFMYCTIPYSIYSDLSTISYGFLLHACNQRSFHFILMILEQFLTRASAKLDRERWCDTNKARRCTPFVSCPVLSRVSEYISLSLCPRKGATIHHSTSTTQYRRNILLLRSLKVFCIICRPCLGPTLITAGRPIPADYHAVSPPCSGFCSSDVGP